MSHIKKNSARIVIEKHQNRQLRTYHLTTQISQDDDLVGIGGILGMRLEIEGTADEKLGELGASLAKRLEGLLGVETLAFKRFEVRVEKADAFLWEEIEPCVLEILKSVYGKTTVDVWEHPDNRIHLLDRLKSEEDKM